MTNQEDISQKADEPKGPQKDLIQSEAETIIAEAGAGTGKTFTMRHRIQRILNSEGQAGQDGTSTGAGEVAPQQILVLTFTRKTAHEIESRLSQKLEQEGYDIDAYTYHSFCRTLIKEFAYQQGLPPDFNVVSGVEKNRLLRSVIDELEYEFVAPFNPKTGTEPDLMEGLNQFIRSLKGEQIASSDIEEWVPEVETIETLTMLIQRLYAKGKGLFDPDEDGNGDLKWGSGSVYQTRLKEYKRIIEKERASLSPTQAFESDVNQYLRNLEYFVDNLIEYYQDQSDIGHPNFDLLKVLFTNDRSKKWFPTIQETPIGRLGAYVAVLQKARLYVAGWELYEHKRIEQNLVDYQDLITAAIDILEDPDTKEAILDRYEYIFCDEFQDTDHVQLDLIEALSATSNLFVIGDQDQAIYEWRGASPENIDNLADRFPDAETDIELDLNFRSRESILRLVDELGTDSHGMDTSRDESDNSILKIDADMDADRPSEAQASQITAAVSQLTTGQLRGVDEPEYDEVAVLTRKRYHARMIAESLSDAGLPVEIPHSSGADHLQGIQAVVNYFRILTDPREDIGLCNVLLYFYRLPTHDLDKLRRGSQSVWDTLQTTPSDQFEASNRVERAASDISTLRARADGMSVSELWGEMKSQTELRWFLTEEERRELSQVDHFVESYNSGETIQASLDADFVDYLEIQVSGGRSRERVETADKVDGKINVMTVHQAKGLQFDVVVLPFLNPQTWTNYGDPAREYVGSYALDKYEYDLIFDESEHSDSENPLLADLEPDATSANPKTAKEAWRILHVGITRARDHVILAGNNAEDGIDGGRTPFDCSPIEDCLPADIEWSMSAPYRPVWQEVCDAIDAVENWKASEVRDITDAVDTATTQYPGALVHQASQLTLKEARNRVSGWLEAVRNGTHPKSDPSDAGYHTLIELTTPTREMERTLSHTALETAAGCQRRYVLDHLVGAFDDPLPDTDSTGFGSAQVSQRKVGVLFHEVAERAFWLDIETESGWLELVTRVARVLDLEEAVEPVRECIRKYFATVPGQTWQRHAAEVPFEKTEFDSDYWDLPAPVVGKIDAIHHDGESYVILDYKTSGSMKEINDSHQLLLYLLVAREMLDIDVTKAGYVYVGEPGPDYDVWELSELMRHRGLSDQLRENFEQAVTASYATSAENQVYTIPETCKDCSHRSIGCAADKYRK